MKKLISILAVISCVFALTACSGTQPNTLEGTPVDQSSAEALITYGEQIVTGIDQIVTAGQEDAYSSDEVLKPALEAYQTSKDDIGDIMGFQNEQAVINDDGNYVVNIGIDGTNHDADIVITFEAQNGQLTNISNIATNVQYSFGELMGQAGMNTVLGMGTTFVVLIILWGLVSCFKFIGRAQNKQKKAAELKAEAEEEAAAPAAVPEAAPEAADQGELIAVIAAAIAASEGKETTDGFVVRSIRKSRPKF